MDKIFKLVVNFSDGSDEVFPRIYFDESKATEKAKAIFNADDECVSVRIYTEMPDAETGSFMTRTWIDIK